MSDIKGFIDFLSENLPQYYMIHKDEFRQRMDILLDEYTRRQNHVEIQEKTDYDSFREKISKLKKKELVDYIRKNEMNTIKISGTKQQLIERICNDFESRVLSNENPSKKVDDKCIQKIRKIILNEYEWSDSSHFEKYVMPKIHSYYNSSIKSNDEMQEQDYHRIFIDIKKM